MFDDFEEGALPTPVDEWHNDYPFEFVVIDVINLPLNISRRIDFEVFSFEPGWQNWCVE